MERKDMAYWKSKNVLPSPNKKAQPGDSPLEKFDWSAALKGAGTGAAVGSAVPGLGTGIGAIAGGLMAGFSSGNKQKKQEDAEALKLKSEEEKDQLILAAKEEAEKTQPQGMDSESK